MSTQIPVENINIVRQELLLTPKDIKKLLPLSNKAEQTVTLGRLQLQSILDRKDPRLFLL